MMEFYKSEHKMKHRNNGKNQLKLVCKPLKAFLVNISDKFSFSTKNSDV